MIRELSSTKVDEQHKDIIAIPMVAVGGGELCLERQLIVGADEVVFHPMAHLIACAPKVNQSIHRGSGLLVQFIVHYLQYQYNSHSRTVRVIAIVNHQYSSSSQLNNIVTLFHIQMSVFVSNGWKFLFKHFAGDIS